MLASELSARLDRMPIGAFHRRVLYGVCFAFFFELADLNSFAYAATGLHKYAHMSLGSIANVTSASFGGMFVGATVGGRLADMLGRRRAPLVAVAVVTAACGLAYGLTFNSAAIIVFGFGVSFFIQTFAALLYAYTPELYPTGLRNTGSGVCYGTGRLANIAGPYIVSAIYGGYGYPWVFGYIAACWALVAVVIGLFGPPTGDVALEELQTPGDSPVRVVTG